MEKIGNLWSNVSHCFLRRCSTIVDCWFIFAFVDAVTNNVAHKKENEQYEADEKNF